MFICLAKKYIVLYVGKCLQERLINVDPEKIQAWKPICNVKQKT